MEILNAGTTLNNRYRLERCIGEGGSAVVYLAHDLKNDCDVAIKIMKPEFVDTPAKIARLKETTSAISKIRHNNIVQLIGLGHDNGRYYLAMQYVDGITLAQLLEAGPLPWRDAAQIAKQVLLALVCAHNHNIVHKDIKPQNLLVDRQMHVYLTDFGVAQIKTSGGTINTEVRQASVYYMSPEQAKNAATDKRTDIYSLGITLYEMILGEVPYHGDSNIQVVMQHVNGKIKPVDIVNPEIPRAISDVVTLATMKEARKRFQSAEEMLDAIKSALDNENQPLFDVAFAIDNAIELPRYNGPANVMVEEQEKKKKKKAKEETAKTSDKKVKKAVEKKPVKEKKKADGAKIGMVACYIAAGILLLGAFGFTGYTHVSRYLDNKKAAGTYTLDNYVGIKADRASEILSQGEILCDFQTVITEEAPIGYIVSQNIDSGKTVVKGDTVVFEVAGSEDTVFLDNYSGRTYEETQLALEKEGLLCEKVEVMSDSEGSVIKTSPASGTGIEKGNTVKVYVNTTGNIEYVEVPDLSSTKNMSFYDANDKLSAVGLVLGNNYPQPGEDLTQYYFPATAEPTVTPVPTVTPTATITPTATPDPNQTVATEVPTPENPDETIIPTSEPTAVPTASPTPSPTPEITATPTAEPVKVYANNYIVDQYPAAGTKVPKGTAVDIYFYNRAALNSLVKQQVTMDFPSSRVTGSEVTFIKIDFVLSDGSTSMASFSNQKYVQFPLTIDVPFTWDGEYTEMYIYVNDTDNVYEKRVIKRQA